MSLLAVVTVLMISQARIILEGHFHSALVFTFSFFLEPAQLILVVKNIFYHMRKIATSYCCLMHLLLLKSALKLMPVSEGAGFWLDE